MRECLDEVTPEQQAKAARFNNRDFIYRQLNDYLNPEIQSEADARQQVKVKNPQRALAEVEEEEEKEDSEESEGPPDLAELSSLEPHQEEEVS